MLSRSYELQRTWCHLMPSPSFVAIDKFNLPPHCWWEAANSVNGDHHSHHCWGSMGTGSLRRVRLFSHLRWCVHGMQIGRMI
jgi:hypothetical protein